MRVFSAQEIKYKSNEEVIDKMTMDNTNIAKEEPPDEDRKLPATQQLTAFTYPGHANLFTSGNQHQASVGQHLPPMPPMPMREAAQQISFPTQPAMLPVHHPLSVIPFLTYLQPMPSSIPATTGAVSNASVPSVYHDVATETVTSDMPGAWPWCLLWLIASERL